MPSYIFSNNLNHSNLGKNLSLFVIGTFLSAITFNLFFLNYHIVPTGSSGLAIIINNYLNLNISIIIFLIGLLCLLLGLIFFGYKYALKMLLITIYYPVFVSLTSHICKYIDLEDTSLFLIMLMGGGLTGLANGIIRRSGYNTGGLGVVFDLMHKYFHLSLGLSSVIINTIIILLSGYVFGLISMIYSFIALMVSSYMVDKVTIGISDNKVFYIITEKPLEIKRYIIDKLGFTATIIDAHGGYSNKRKKILMCVISTRTYIKLKDLVNEIDPTAFFLIVDVYESSIKEY